MHHVEEKKESVHSFAYVLVFSYFNSISFEHSMSICRIQNKSKTNFVYCIVENVLYTIVTQKQPSTIASIVTL